MTLMVRFVGGSFDQRDQLMPEPLAHTWLIPSIDGETYDEYKLVRLRDRASEYHFRQTHQRYPGQG